jgi:hypothetical protein
MKLASPLPVIGSACGSSARVTENRPFVRAATGAEFKKQPPSASRSQSPWFVGNIQRDQRNAVARRVNSKGTRDLCLKMSEFNGWIAGTRRNTFARRDGQSASAFFSLHCSSRTRMTFSRVLQPQEKSQQQHSNSRLYSQISYCRLDAKRS